MVTKVIIAVIAIPLVLIVIRGLWRATAAQDGPGCPCCAKLTGEADEHHEHDTCGAKGHPKA